MTEQIKLIALAELAYINETIDALSQWTTDKRLCKHKISKDVVRTFFRYIQKALQYKIH